MYRSYIAQKKYTVVLDEVLDSSPAEVQAVRLLAQYLHSPSKRYVYDILVLQWQVPSYVQGINS